MTSRTISAQHIQSLIDNKTKPIGSLGVLEALAVKIAVLQQSAQPRMAACELLIFIADHGIVADGVSAFPPAVTAQMAHNFLAGGAAANVLAKANGVGVTLVDAGMASAVEHPNLINARIVAGTQNFRTTPAMTALQRDRAIDRGAKLTSEIHADAFCFGEMGIGNTSSASLLLHKVLAIPLVDLVGRGTGLTDQGLAQKTAILSEAAQRTADRLSAHEALAEYGGFEIAMMAGGMLAAADARKLVLVDGFIATSAAVLAMEMEPGCKDALIFCHRSGEQGHQAVLDALSIKPLLDLSLRLGEGTGAILAWPLLKSAAAMLNEMASFESAQVDGPRG